MSVLLDLRAILTDISDALRSLNNTTKKYTLPEVADAIKEGCQVYYLGKGTSFDVTSISGYESFTKNNFIVCADAVESIRVSSWGSNDSTNEDNYLYPSWTKSYNATTGKFKITQPDTLTKQATSYSVVGDSNVYHYAAATLAIAAPAVYLVVGNIKSV